MIPKDVENSLTENKPFSEANIGFVLVINGSAWIVNLGDTHILLADGSKYKDYSTPALCRDESQTNTSVYSKKFLRSLKIRDGEIKESVDGIKRLEGGSESLRAIRKRSPLVKGNSTRPQVTKLNISEHNAQRLFIFSEYKVLETIDPDHFISMTKNLPIDRAANFAIEKAIQLGCIDAHSVMAINLKI